MEKFKIFYAINNSFDSILFLKRFLQYSTYDIKIAAYANCNFMDFNLSSLHCVKHPNIILIDHDNANVLVDYINKFNPDLIISDFEPCINNFISYFKAPVWQVSQDNICHGLTINEKSSLGLFFKFGSFINSNPIEADGFFNNSDKNFVVSHFCDLEIVPKLKDNFHWIRPYHYIGKNHNACRYDCSAASEKIDINIYKFLKKYNYSIYFCNSTYEQFNKIKLKNFDDEDYICNIHNSNVLICDGSSTVLGDCFYNNRYVYIFHGNRRKVQIINAYLSEKYKLAKILYGYESLPLTSCSFDVIFNKSVRYLHEEINYQFGLK